VSAGEQVVARASPVETSELRMAMLAIERSIELEGAWWS
jgi:hypothetical protein